MIAETIARLKATVPALKLVGGTADFQAAVESNPKATPACFVILNGERPAPCAMASVMMQDVTARIGLVLVVRNLGDSHGAAAGIDLQQLRQLVKDKVYGWVPAEGCSPLERGEGELLVYRDGHVWWQDIFFTSYIDRSMQ